MSEDKSEESENEADTPESKSESDESGADHFFDTISQDREETTPIV
ncbi:hypothetical protein AYI69_g11359, partial [Smittium culicis]